MQFFAREKKTLNVLVGGLNNPQSIDQHYISICPRNKDFHSTIKEGAHQIWN